MAHFRLTSAGATDTGLARSANEDSLLMRDDVGVWCVADGMGGFQNGKWASHTVVETLAAAPIGADFQANLAALGDALQAANAHIYQTAQSSQLRMGSTVVILHLLDDHFGCVWVGDSRMYLLRAGELHRLSTDHTQVQEMVDRGLLSLEEAHGHPMGHVLSRAVGVQETMILDAVVDAIQSRDVFLLQSRDVFLLCSDGLTGVVSEAEIAERLRQFSPEVACRRLIELVLSRGAPDNVTILAVACEEATQLVFGTTAGAAEA
jgi:serine/threonine protein phosphatase PrpC